MTKILSANQTQKIDRPHIQPVYLVHVLLSGLTLYFSDRNYSYNGHNYEAYLYDLTDIGNEIRNLGGYDNAQVTLQFKNDPIMAKNTLIELFDDYPPEKKYIEIYKILIDTGETFGSDVSTEIFKGEMSQPYEVVDPPVDFKIDCSSMLFGKNVSLPLDVIDLADFPSADPDDVGKYRNIPVGAIKKLVCPWTVAGWTSTLVADITSSATSLDVTDAGGSPAVPFTAIIDNEQIRVTAKSGNSFTAVIRAYGGTTAVAHNKGQVIYEQRADFEAEVSQYPVKSIGDVYAKRDDEWIRIISGVTAYTNSGGRAKLVFSDKIKFEEKTILAASNSINEGSHGHGANEGTHIHTLSVVPYSTKKCIPTGATGGTNPANTIDGNEDSKGTVTSGNTITISFTETDLGTINKQYIHIMVDSSTSTIMCGGTTISSGLSAPTGRAWYRLTKTGGAWDDNIVIYGGGSGSGICEVYKEIEYTPAPTIDTHAASGVGVNSGAAAGIDVTTSLTGNSVANMLIGDIVACDLEGIPDDGSGAYTGAPNALIERPDHVRKYILMGLLGFSAPDIHSSFGDVGTIYAARISGGYKFSFNLPDVATEAMILFKKMDEQTRSNMFESQGKFKLAFNSTDVPTSQITFTKDNVRGSFVFNKTEVVDIRNRIRAHYFRDYSKRGSVGEMYQKINEESDATSITKYGDLQEDLEFDCIGDLSLMVDDVLDWNILREKDVKKLVEFEAFWDAMILDHCDHFTVTSTFWSGLKFKTLTMIEKPETQLIELKGEQFVSS